MSTKKRMTRHIRGGLVFAAFGAGMVFCLATSANADDFSILVQKMGRALGLEAANMVAPRSCKENYVKAVSEGLAVNGIHVDRVEAFPLGVTVKPIDYGEAAVLEIKAGIWSKDGCSEPGVDFSFRSDFPKSSDPLDEFGYSREAMRVLSSVSNRIFAPPITGPVPQALGDLDEAPELAKICLDSRPKNADSTGRRRGSGPIGKRLLLTGCFSERLPNGQWWTYFRFMKN